MAPPSQRGGRERTRLFVHAGSEGPSCPPSRFGDDAGSPAEPPGAGAAASGAGERTVSAGRSSAGGRIPGTESGGSRYFFLENCHMSRILPRQEAKCRGKIGRAHV